MSRSINQMLALGLMAFATPALSKPYTFVASGNVTSMYSADRDCNQVQNPPSTIKVGDKFSVRFLIEPSTATPGTFYAADPNINIYSHHVTNLAMRGGRSFLTLPGDGEQTFATFQLWNNYIVGSQATDAFVLATLRFLPNGSSPVDLGSGQINAQFHYSAFDFTSTARASDALTELPPLDRYGSRSGFFAFFNSDTRLQSIFQVSFSQASLSAVPEPSAWIFIASGFGLIGTTLRKHRQRGEDRISASYLT